MAVIKIMINWEERKIIHTTEHRGSADYNHLKNTFGYEEVGSIKTSDFEEGLTPSNKGWIIPQPKVFWEPNFFDPEVKYFKPQK